MGNSYMKKMRRINRALNGTGTEDFADFAYQLRRLATIERAPFLRDTFEGSIDDDGKTVPTVLTPYFQRASVAFDALENPTYDEYLQWILLLQRSANDYDALELCREALEVFPEANDIRVRHIWSSVQIETSKTDDLTITYAEDLLRENISFSEVLGESALSAVEYLRRADRHGDAHAREALFGMEKQLEFLSDVPEWRSDIGDIATIEYAVLTGRTYYAATLYERLDYHAGHDPQISHRALVSIAEHFAERHEHDKLDRVLDIGLDDYLGSRELIALDKKL